ncbi:hypothetical protein L1987_51223 [Smallanthus sonchifolius]|uniref:Uncharacterized protein n=1 Tax=Smallanthus sonchifolius TaxID=185202 RepID=A0ACB9EP77_9ASTR|nr:hypothetical protein L1987_51223 [Smallanthus sonchifolius]
METVNILHMNPGDKESSYARNSLLQETVLRKALPVLKRTIKGNTSRDLLSGQCFRIADLGCASGKNALLLATNVMDIVIEASVPGSFYCRLFSDQSLHLVHSSYSVHWLSQVPEGLESSALNIYMAKTSPLNVFQSYQKQFKTDFTKLLQLRSEEIVSGGCMVLTLVGRSVADPTSDDGCLLWELLAQSLHDMVKEGLVRESDINSFNVPIYYPCEDEVRNVIQNEGSFSLESLTTFQVNWDPRDTDYKNSNDSNGLSQTHAENTAKAVKAFTEPLLTSHFGKSIIDGLFKKYSKRVAQHLTNNKTRYFNLVISLAKK